MVQATTGQAEHVTSCKSSRQDVLVSTRQRSGRRKYSKRNTRDLIMYLEGTSASDSYGSVEDATRRVTRNMQRAVAGDHHSGGHHQQVKQTKRAVAGGHHQQVKQTKRAVAGGHHQQVKQTQRAVAGDEHSGGHHQQVKQTKRAVAGGHHQQVKQTKRAVPSPAMTTVQDSAKADSCQNHKLERNVEYIERATVLLDWIVKPLPDIRGICVEGQKQGMDDYWHSAAIVEAVRPTIVVTATGSVYRLQGKVNKYCTIDNGFPKDVAEAFTKGFPHNWKQIIQDFYRQLENSISIVAECSPLKGKKVQQRRHQLVENVKRRKTPSISCQQLEAVDHAHGSIWTPAGLLKQKLSTDDVTVTRSGRVSLPPLARWTGQCYRRIPNSSDIEVTFETDCAKKTLQDTTAHLLQLPKSSLKMIYNKSLSKSFQLPADSMTKLFERKLSLTVDMLEISDEVSPLVANTNRTKKSPDVLVAGQKINQKVNNYLRNVGEDMRTGISCKLNKSEAKVGAAVDTNLKLSSNKTNRCDHLENISEHSATETHPDDVAGKPGKHTRGLTRDHMEYDRSLIVVLSRNLPGGVSSQQMNTAQLLTKLATSLPGTEQDIRPIRKLCRPTAHKNTSSSTSDITFIQSADCSGTRLNKSNKKHVRESPTNQCLQADSNGSRSQESTDSSSADIQGRRSHRHKKTAKTRNKKTEICENKMLHAGGNPVKSNCKPGRRSLSGSSARYGLKEADVKPSAAVKAAKSCHVPTCTQPAVGVDLIKPSAAGKTRQVSGTRKRKRDDDDDAVRDGVEANHTIVVRKPRKRMKLMDETLSAGDVMWHDEETDLFHRALKEVNGADCSYWQKISTIVGTRSEAECQHFYKHYLEGKVGKKPRKSSNTSHKHKDKKGRKKGDPIRGGKGTLKRKQDLREFLQEQDEGYEDNLFEGSPFVNRRKQSALFTVNVDKTDSEIFGANHNCITPVAGTSAISMPGTFLRAKMVSVKKTPQSDHVTVLDNTPVSFNRRKADQYIKSFIDRKRHAQPGSVVVQSDLNVLDLSDLPMRSLFSPISQPSIVIDSHNTEEDDDEHNSPYMYYWNDES